MSCRGMRLRAEGETHDVYSYFLFPHWYGCVSSFPCLTLIMPTDLCMAVYVSNSVQLWCLNHMCFHFKLWRNSFIKVCLLKLHGAYSPFKRQQIQSVFVILSTNSEQTPSFWLEKAFKSSLDTLLVGFCLLCSTIFFLQELMNR